MRKHYTKEQIAEFRRKDKARVKDITQKLEEGVRGLFESDKWKAFLDTMAQFHTYTWRNTLMVMAQKPDATRIAGAGLWKKLGRNIIKGQKALWVLGPQLVRRKTEDDGVERMADDPDTQGEGTYMVFRLRPVFDVSQTEGKELPDICNDLKGDAYEYQRFHDAIVAISPVPIETCRMHGTVHGWFSPKEHKIVIRNGMSERQTLKTMIHELTHAKLHNEEEMKVSPKDQRTMEVEAESVAYVVTKHYGLDSSDYSFGYIAGWGDGKDMKVLGKSMSTIQKTSREIIDMLNERMGRQTPKERRAMECAC